MGDKGAGVMDMGRDKVIGDVVGKISSISIAGRPEEGVAETLPLYLPLCGARLTSVRPYNICMHSITGHSNPSTRCRHLGVQ